MFDGKHFQNIFTVNIWHNLLARIVGYRMLKIQYSNICSLLYSSFPMQITLRPLANRVVSLLTELCLLSRYRYTIQQACLALRGYGSPCNRHLLLFQINCNGNRGSNLRPTAASTLEQFRPPRVVFVFRKRSRLYAICPFHIISGEVDPMQGVNKYVNCSELPNSREG